ncbi:MAG: metalloregulator ArsR/SmtB family transcription factor [Candidatus Omnitrophica bacterium]|nr:metalloregulator ArsR/SmtB family transcription factor [Candidatus Omnitrophota bacterium]
MKIDKFIEAAEIFRAFSHPVRLGIVVQLLRKKDCVSNIKRLLAVSQSVVSKQLSLLKDWGIVECQRKGQKKCYFLKNVQLVKDIVKIIEKNSCIKNKIFEEGEK